MIFPDNSADKLGFTEIKERIKLLCLSPMGQQMVSKIQMITKFEIIQKFLNQTHEFVQILQGDDALPIQSFHDLKKLADKIRLEGAFLSEEEFFQIHTSLQTVFSVIGYFDQKDELYPNLITLFQHLPVEKGIIKEIELVIDQKGKIRPNASALLQEISLKIGRAEKEANKKIDQIFKNAQQNNWTADGGLTIRDGRICIPLLAENKRKVKGFVHDESASGQTVYLEPEEVFTLNNQLRDLEFDYRRETIRILTALTDKLRPYAPLLISYHDLLSKLDFVRAKALFAIEIDAALPKLLKEPTIKLINARHPLLFIKHKADKKPVVPLNTHLDEKGRILLVSGPNAGGKSVCMKTVGLLQMMLQAGLLIPVSEYSELGIFRQVFVDIGDDQSMESDLSTYSAHLSKMKYFVEHANFHTLVLIDEFGTGTDPQFGGPMAEAVLEMLNQKKVKGVVTTHYSNLKVFANHAEGLENASMIFDNQEMKPLYILEMGKPGSSYAFEIAQKIGLPAHIINLAKNKVGVQQKKVDTLLVDLERDQKEMLQTKTALEKQQKYVQQMVAENESLKSYLEENKKVLLKEAKLQAQQIIKDANKLVEQTISEIKSTNADKENTIRLRETLKQEVIKNQVTEERKTASKSEEIEKGDWIKLEDSETLAQVMEINKNNLIVAIGDLRSVIKKDRAVKVSNKQVPKTIRKNIYTQSTEEAANYKTELDVRGMRTDNALSEVENMLDKALISGFNSLKIIHGKGDGILRKMIRNYLKGYKEVKKLEDEHPDRGGDGITYVYLS